MADTYPFLSDEWIVETKRLRDEFRKQASPPATTSRLLVNLVVTDVPFGAPALEAHLDTTSGEPEIDLGHLPQSDLEITTTYDTARSIFIDGQMGKALEALQLGRIRVDGSMLKLFALAKIGGDARSAELTQRIRAITE